MGIDCLVKLRKLWQPPSNVTYGILIKGCDAEGMTDKPYELCRQMVDQGYLPSTRELNLVI
jgi:pentatricopeptide repeat protein